MSKKSKDNRKFGKKKLIIACCVLLPVLWWFTWGGGKLLRYQVFEDCFGILPPGSDATHLFLMTDEQVYRARRAEEEKDVE